MRIEYARYSTLERARDALEDMFASGDVCEGERPKIETKRDHRGRVVAYVVTVNG